MEFDVFLDFHDRAVSAPHRCKDLTELAAYLERIPGMIGFEIHHEVEISVRAVPLTPAQERLKLHLTEVVALDRFHDLPFNPSLPPYDFKIDLDGDVTHNPRPPRRSNRT